MRPIYSGLLALFLTIPAFGSTINTLESRLNLCYQNVSKDDSVKKSIPKSVIQRFQNLLGKIELSKKTKLYTYGENHVNSTDRTVEGFLDKSASHKNIYFLNEGRLFHLEEEVSGINNYINGIEFNEIRSLVSLVIARKFATYFMNSPKEKHSEKSENWDTAKRSHLSLTRFIKEGVLGLEGYYDAWFNNQDFLKNKGANEALLNEINSFLLQRNRGTNNLSISGWFHEVLDSEKKILAFLNLLELFIPLASTSLSLMPNYEGYTPNYLLSNLNTVRELKFVEALLLTLPHAQKNDKSIWMQFGSGHSNSVNCVIEALQVPNLEFYRVSHKEMEMTLKNWNAGSLDTIQSIKNFVNKLLSQYDDTPAVSIEVLKDKDKVSVAFNTPQYLQICFSREDYFSNRYVELLEFLESKIEAEDLGVFVLKKNSAKPCETDYGFHPTINLLPINLYESGQKQQK